MIGADPYSMLASMGLDILSNNAKRNHQAMQTVGNAEMMRYSPWTKLAQTAALAQNENLKFNPQADLAERTAGQLKSITGQAGEGEGLMDVLKKAFGGGDQKGDSQDSTNAILNNSGGGRKMGSQYLIP